MGFFDFFKNKTESKETLDKGLEKTKTGFLEKITKAITGKSTVDAELLDSLEEILLGADVGSETTSVIIDKIERRVASQKYVNTSELNAILKEEVYSLFSEKEAIESKLTTANIPYVILVVGVNGVGKTTTIGKLANKYKSAGKSVVLGAGDTFRAAAVEQLTIWADRTGVDIVKQQQGADPSAVAFDTVQSAVATKKDIVIIDTAGRLHNKINLMNELSKIKRVMQKVRPDVPQEVLLVLDGSTGQNAIEQAKQFTAATEVTGIVLTKLDGTAKGGVVLAIAHQFNIPVRYIGVGEKMEDLQVFNSKQFVDSLFGDF
jgi:fused signal recognition particle receptor